VFASLALSLIGCAGQNKLATFSKGDAALQVKLPDVCEAFLQRVPEPAVTRKTDARVATVRFANALHEANDRIGAGGDCFRDERTAYEGKGKPK
jgi:hypothetical protein